VGRWRSRPVRDDEDLALIFTWQEERNLSKNPTLHYQRMYVVEPRPETLRLAGERCCVHEYAGGRIEVRHAGQVLPCRVFFDSRPVSASIHWRRRLGSARLGRSGFGSRPGSAASSRRGPMPTGARYRTT